MTSLIKTIKIKSGAAAQKLRAQPGLDLNWVIDGVPYTGQTHIHGKAVRLVRKGRALEVHIEGQRDAALVVQDFYAANHVPESAEPQVLSDQQVQLVLQSGASQPGAHADAPAAPVAPVDAAMAQTAASSTGLSTATAPAPVADKGVGSGTLLLGALPVAALAGGGGGGGGGGGSAPSPAPAPQPVSTTINGQVMLGPVIAGHQLTVQLYQADGTTPLGSPVAVDNDGRSTATVTGYSGVIKAKLIDGASAADFKDEATGASKDVNAELWAVGNVTSGTPLTLNINPLTTLAYNLVAAHAVFFKGITHVKP
jgi:hypothetical protein